MHSTTLAQPAPAEPDATVSLFDAALNGQQSLAGILAGVVNHEAEEPGNLAVATRPQHPQDNWLEFIGAGVAGGFASGIGADVYTDAKAACRAAVERYRDRRPDPDEQQEWMHQLVADAFIGPCPPGHKLIHVNGDGLDNRRVNLAYVPEPDPRPAAPLKRRPAGHFSKTAVTSTGSNEAGELLPETIVDSYKTVHLKKPRPDDVINKTAVTRKKRRKGRKKYR
jgi:hypothetical protein